MLSVSTIYASIKEYAKISGFLYVSVYRVVVKYIGPVPAVPFKGFVFHLMPPVSDVEIQPEQETDPNQDNQSMMHQER